MASGEEEEWSVPKRSVLMARSSLFVPRREGPAGADLDEGPFEARIGGAVRQAQAQEVRGAAELRDEAAAILAKEKVRAHAQAVEKAVIAFQKRGRLFGDVAAGEHGGPHRG